MKKLVILVSLLFLLTGCSVKYKININEDLKVTEIANIYGNSDLYKVYNRTSHKNVLKELLSIYEDILKEKSYQYKVNEDSNPSIFIEKEYLNIQNYIDNSILLNDYFDEISYTKKGNIVTIETIGFNNVDEDLPERFYVNNVDIEISLPYKVTNHNAKSFKNKTNTYLFRFDDKTKDFKIFLEFDISKKHNPNIRTYIIILITILIMIFAWILVAVFNKKKKMV